MASKGAIARGVLQAWGRILAGYQPNLSIEITRECPLTCPGCYAYGNDIWAARSRCASCRTSRARSSSTRCSR